MIGRPRGGAPLLAGLAAGAVLGASAMLVAPPALPLSSPKPLAAVAPVPRTTTTVPAPRPSPTPLLQLPRPLELLTPPTTTPLPTTTTTTTEPTTTPPPEPQPKSEPEPELGATDAVIAATNAARVDAGCDELGFDPRLAAAAQGHSEDMAENGYFSHTGLDGSTFDERIRDQGHPDPGGENIARGQESAAEVVAGWMDSPGHRRNILDCDFVDIGVGLDPRGNYWTQEFGL